MHALIFYAFSSVVLVGLSNSLDRLICLKLMNTAMVDLEYNVDNFGVVDQENFNTEKIMKHVLWNIKHSDLASF